MRQVKCTIVAAATLLLMAGCGGSNRDGDKSADTGSVADRFLAQIQQMISSAAETTEPVEVGSIELSTPENREPIPLG